MPPDEDEGEEKEDEGGGQLFLKREEVEDAGGGQFLLKEEGVEDEAGGLLLSKAKKKSDLEVPVSFDANISCHRNGVSLTEISRNENENNNLKQRHITADQSSPSDLSSSSPGSTIKLRITKSVENQPFGIVIQGGTDAPYIDENGEEKTQMRVKEIRSGAAARQKALRVGMQVRRVNDVDVRGKTHKEIAELTKLMRNQLDLDIINDDNVRSPVQKEVKSDNENDNNNVVEIKAASNASVAASADAAARADPAAAAAKARAAEREAEREAERRHNAANAAILHATAAANATQIAAKNASIEAAKNELEKRLLELQRMREENEDVYLDEEEEELEEEADEEKDAVEAYEEEENKRERRGRTVNFASPDDDASVSADSKAESSTLSTNVPSDSSKKCAKASPRSTIMWGAVATHVLEPQTTPTTPTTPMTPTTQSASSGTTPSPYHIPTPSPLPRRSPVDDGAPKLLQERRCDTPYPICFPSLPTASEDDRKTPAPPQIDVAETLKQVVEKTPFERPLTSWSIHDPTEDKNANKRDSQLSLITESDFSDPTALESSANADANFDAPFDVARHDPLSEAAACKWRPTTPPISHKRRRNQKSTSAASSRPSTPPTRGLTSSSAAAATATSPASRREDHMYLFVGSLTLLAASGMVGLFLKKRYE